MPEVAIPPAVLEKILSSISDDTVLVGGQSLAFWVSHYKVELPQTFLVGAISDDADFLGKRDDVAAIARTVAGSVPSYTSQRSMSALIGQVTIQLTPPDFANVDILHRLVGPSNKRVHDNAMEVEIGSARFLVMHPIDVLFSRIENLAQLPEKQNLQGVEQARLSIQVARSYIEELAIEPDNGQQRALKTIEYVVQLAKSGHGKKVTREFGIDFRGAIPSYAICSEKFKTIRLPQILEQLQPTPRK